MGEKFAALRERRLDEPVMRRRRGLPGAGDVLPRLLQIRQDPVDADLVE